MTKEEIELTIEYLKSIQEGYIEVEGYERYPLPEWYALDKAIELIELLGQEESILDKIRAEIRALSPEPTAIDVVDGNPVKTAIWEIIADVLEIIDKYKVESEDEGDDKRR